MERCQSLSRAGALSGQELVCAPERSTAEAGAAQELDDDPAQTATELHNRSVRLLDRYTRHNDLDALQAALDAAHKATQLDPTVPGSFSQLGRILYTRFQHFGKFADLERAVAELERAVAMNNADTEERIHHLDQLGITLQVLYQNTGNQRVLDRRIAIARRVVDSTADHAVDKPRWISFLGMAIMQQYWRDGALDRLHEAIDHLERARDACLPEHSEYPVILDHLGIGYRNRFDATEAPQDLARAIECFVEAAQLMPEDSAQYPTVLTNLASGLGTRYQQVSRGLKDLERSIANYQRAIERTPPDAPVLLLRLGNLATMLVARYEHIHARDDIDRAIEILNSLIRQQADDAPLLAKHWFGLGQALLQLYLQTDDQMDMRRGMSAFEQASRLGLTTSIQVGFQAADQWLTWAFSRRAWDQVARAHDYAHQCSEKLVRIQLLRRHQEDCLAQTQGMAARAAYALAKQGELERAVVALERGQARLLSDALARDRADLDQLPAQGYGELLERYREASDRWNTASDKTRALYQTLDQIVGEIQRIPGFEHFLALPSFCDIARAARDQPIVYIVATELGGLALCVPSSAGIANRSSSDSDTISAIWLPRLTATELDYRLEGGEADHIGYLTAYRDWRNDKKNQTKLKTWHDSLDDITQWLWAAIMWRLVPALPDCTSATLIPVGRLALLPLHATWTTDPDDATRRIYALDVLTISYAPNARSRLEAMTIAERVRPDSLLAIAEPASPKAGPLPNSTDEVRAIARLFQQSTILGHRAATHNNTVKSLPLHSSLHFAGHASANLQKPLASGVRLADRDFTLADLLELRHGGLRLVTLSACETGVPGAKLPDEVVNLPSGFLLAGAGGIVSSLWSADDISTMLLMVRFYYQWHKQNTEPRRALTEAQQWIRDSTNDEKQQYLEAICSADNTGPDSRSGSCAARQILDEGRPWDRDFQHPFHWAAFTYVGV
ncbi:MAG: CHAT domain-containing protein [Proteobacteria bacterium]|nr:CHAT domain-containing protein [Pseudomonadota bacterium]